MEDLKTILKAELVQYAGQGLNCYAFPLFDDQHQTYAVNVVDYPQRKRASDMVVFARLLGDTIIIEEDFSDKPFYQALMAKGIPREQIVLIYQGESYPAGAIPAEAKPSI